MGDSVCRLCGQVAELCDSHIVSEFLYLPLYDEKHRVSAIKAEEGAKEDTLQKGIRERLLCKSCETKLSRHETFASRVLRDLPNWSDVRPGELVVVPTGNYASFKLFQLSLLWRMGAASKPTFRIDLGPHEPRLRAMLLSENPGEPLQYGCFLVGTAGPGRAQEFLKPPVDFRVEGHRAYVAFFLGLAWVWVVSSHSIRLPQVRSFLAPNGDLPINVSSRTLDEMWGGVAAGMRELGVL